MARKDSNSLLLLAVNIKYSYIQPEKPLIWYLYEGGGLVSEPKVALH